MCIHICISDITTRVPATVPCGKFVEALVVMSNTCICIHILVSGTCRYVCGEAPNTVRALEDIAISGVGRSV